MMRGLYFVAFLCAALAASAQQKQVTISNSGVTSNINKDEVTGAAQKKVASTADSLLAMMNRKEIDSIKSIVNTIAKKKVYSEKQWKKLYDSLVTLPNVNQPAMPEFPIKEVNERELVDAVNQKFFAGKDSIESGWKNLPDVPNGNVENPANGLSVPTELPSAPDLKELKLPVESKLTLRELPGSVIPTSYLKDVDSIRNLRLDASRLKLDEKKVAAEETMVAFKDKPSFWDRSYFEGVVGVGAGENVIVQAAPTIGYHFTDYLSLGIGPNILVKESDKELDATVGGKAFFKAEFLKRQGYFQVEDIMDTYGITSAEEPSKKFYEQHNIFIGGGWLLSIKAPVTINFSALYCVTENETVQSQFSPFVFRIGISTVKLKK